MTGLWDRVTCSRLGRRTIWAGVPCQTQPPPPCTRRGPPVLKNTTKQISLEGFCTVFSSKNYPLTLTATAIFIYTIPLPRATCDLNFKAIYDLRQWEAITKTNRCSPIVRGDFLQSACEIASPNKYFSICSKTHYWKRNVDHFGQFFRSFFNK